MMDDVKRKCLFNCCFKRSMDSFLMTDIVMSKIGDW